MREKLLDLLVRHSYRYDPAAPFLLSSGGRSTYYVDCRATTMRGEAMDLVGALVAELLPPGAQAVGGLTMGADPIAHAVASWSTRHGREMNVFSVRKEPKKHGTGKWIEGCVERGTRVAVVDDVVTTGGSTIEAMKRCRDEGIVVEGIVVLVDRQEGGLAAVQREAGAGVPARAVFTREELQARWTARRAAGV
jgi:orotate phosphoribosyltransferase